MKEIPLNQKYIEKTLYTIFRLLFSLIFIVAGSGHIFSTHKVAARIINAPLAPYLELFMPIPVHVFLAGIVLLIGGIGLMLGSWTKVSALALIAVLIPITLTAQLGGEESVGPLFKNIALIGGLIYFAYFGSNGWHFDQLEHRRKRVYISVLKTISIVFLIFAFLPNVSSKGLVPKVHASEIKAAIPLPKGLAILVREAKHLQIAILTGIEGLKGKDEIKLSSVSIIVCGKLGVESLKLGSPIKKSLDDAQAAGIRVVACNLSLKEAGITNSQLEKTVSIVENGLWEMVRLQSVGNYSIEL
ncbi:MAG: hypothetical protein B7Y39_08875 [Bdellovibrio sp. 28-41-41]|nr:MAG: hypothetical protein B7Y39_08875 [Bdellovibrio sp. 28-41-41]